MTSAIIFIFLTLLFAWLTFVSGGLFFVVRMSRLMGDYSKGSYVAMVGSLLSALTFFGGAIYCVIKLVSMATA